MTSPLPKAPAAATRIMRMNLSLGPNATARLERELRTAVAAMPRKLHGVPKRFRAWAYGVTRTDQRTKPAGQLPAYAVECLKSGAPLSDVLGPLNVLIGWVRSHAPRLKLAEAIEAQGKELGEANSAALRLIKDCENPPMDALNTFIRETQELIEAANQALDAAYVLRYKEREAR